MSQFTKRQSSMAFLPEDRFLYLNTLNRLKLYLINDCVSWPCARRPYVHLCRHDEDRQTASAEITDLPQSCLLTAKHLMRKAVLMPTTWSSTYAHWLYMHRYNIIIMFMAHWCLQSFVTMGWGPQHVNWLALPHLQKGWVVAWMFRYSGQPVCGH